MSGSERECPGHVSLSSVGGYFYADVLALSMALPALRPMFVLLSHPGHADDVAHILVASGARARKATEWVVRIDPVGGAAERAEIERELQNWNARRPGIDAELIG